jgi:predicted Fe-Mo cluster-binding NifX family protein
MRIAVATDDGVTIATHTGRCRGIVVFEMEDGNARRLEERQNVFTPHARGECQGDEHAHASGHHSHGALVDAVADCQVLVTRGLGPRLVADLNARGIDAYVSTVEGVDDAASLFAKGLLPRAQGTGCHHR